MKILFYFTFFLNLNYTFGQTPSNDIHWQLVWQDDFNTFDNNKWVKSDYCDHGGEPSLTLAQNVWTSGGNLVIMINNNPAYCPSNPPTIWTACGSCNVGTHNFTSGWVENKSSFNIQYGYIEARIKIPYGKGLWPAFWTFVGDGVNGSNAAEIDIAEMSGDLSDKIYLQNYPPDQIFGTNIHKDYSSPDVYGSSGWMSSYTNWHTYAIEWSPTRIIWYIDDYPVRLFANHGIVDPIRIIFGIGIQRDNNGNPLTNNSTPFPSYMFVDYIRIYELNEDCSNYINSTNYDFSSYNNFEKNFIIIGQGGGSNSLLVGDDIKLRASQYIVFCGDFYVPVGASLYADANKDCPTDLGIQCTQTFNPCMYNFSTYDNSIKRIFYLGGNGCTINLIPTINNISLDATDYIVLNPGVTLTPFAGKSVELKIVPCY